jgi:glucokinase
LQADRERLEVLGIGIGMCGPLDYAKGISLIQGVDKYESIYGINLKDEFRRRLGLPDTYPIEFDIDTWDFARGETWQGNAQGFRRILAIALGTGLGSAFIADGEILADGPGVPPPYGWIGGLPYKDGILDDAFSRRGILSIYKHLSGKPTRKDFDVKHIAQRARKNDSLCLQVFQKFGELFGKALRPILGEFQAECLVFGGQISRSFDLFEQPLEKSLTGLPCLEKITVARSIRLSPIRGAAYRVLS